MGKEKSLILIRKKKQQWDSCFLPYTKNTQEGAHIHTQAVKRLVFFFLIKHDHN